MNKERTLMRSPSERAVAQRAAYQEVKKRKQPLAEMANLEVAQKKCFKCNQEKPLTEFYPHPQMKDGRLNKCKQCTKSDVGKHRSENHQKVCEYDNWRTQTESRRANFPKYRKSRMEKSPEKFKARFALNNAVRDGKIQKQPCEICGRKAQAHHDDYSKPLEVRWMCFQHHREICHGHKVEMKDFLL